MMLIVLFTFMLKYAVSRNIEFYSFVHCFLSRYSWLKTLCHLNFLRFIPNIEVGS